MANFANQISDLVLYQELGRAAGRDGIDQADVDRLKGLVNEVADTVGPVMAQIPVTFRQYTVHDIRHCRNVIDRMGDVVPKETREKLNALEITFLLLSALLHDIGMVVSDQEKAETLGSESFRRFRVEGHSDRNKAIEDARSAGNEPRARAIEDALLAEYYRRLHPERVWQFMDSLLSGKFRYREIDFSDDLARLCESHAWGVEESNDGRHPEKAVVRLDDNVRLYGVRVNLQYLACILRLGDILDFDRSRTPLAVFQHLDFTESKSWEEWNKHIQVKGWDITPTQIAFDIPCTLPVFYVAIHEFLGWIDDELRQCRYLAENKPRPTAERYTLLVPHVVDRHKVRMADPSYIAGAFRFQLEYENILQLLMDKSLYPDPSLFLRELLQNALDACRRKEAEMEVAGIKKFYKPKIVVWDRSDDPQTPRIIFQDNGIGMSQRIIEQYFLRVGRSFYRSPEFDVERQRLREHGKELDACSQFGIGILSCFLVADRFEVETYQQGNEPLHIIVEGPTKYFVMRKLRKPDPESFSREDISDSLDGPPLRTGTKITVHLRQEMEVNTLDVLDTFAVNIEYPVRVYAAKRKQPKVIGKLRWEEPVEVSRHIFQQGRRQVVRSRQLRLEALEEYLIASFVPFKEWELSSHIRGIAWFWLLRGAEGNPLPRVGYLRIGKYLTIQGIPEFVADLERGYISDGSPVIDCARFDKIVEMAEGEESTGDSTDERLASEWQQFTDEERLVIREAIERRVEVKNLQREPLQFWAASPKALESLLEGSLGWASERVYFGYYREVSNRPEDDALALHSLRIPAGIVRWTPSAGTSTRQGLLTLFGGSRIDVRTAKAPQPAAHRLFVAAEQAECLKQQYFGAVLRHGISLAGRYGEGGGWRSWLAELWEIAQELGLSREAASELIPLMQEKCSLAVVQGGKPGRLKYGELLKRCGEIVPLKWSSQSEDFGLLGHDSINRLFMGETSFYEVDFVNISVIPFQGVPKRKHKKR